MFKSPIDRVLIVFSVVLAIFMAFSTGVNTQAGQWLNALSAAISGFFFIGIVWAVIWGRFAQLKDEVRRQTFEEAKKLGAEMAESLAKMIAEHEGNKPEEDDELDEHTQGLANVVMQASAEVLQGEHRIPTDEEIKLIEARFTEITGDHAVKLTNEGHGLSAEFIRVAGKIPVERTEGEDEQPVATHTAPEAPKLSKSQQRRVNAQKGLGALTDDEVKAARNEKRRAARAAKKAAETEPTLKEKVAQQS